MKKLLTFLFLFLTVVTSAFGQQLRWIPFTWESATLAGRRFDKVAIMVPVRLDKLPHKFKMQLDLGALNTMVYGNSIDPCLTKYPALKARLDTTRSFYIQSQKNAKLAATSIALGNVSFGAHDIGYFKNFGSKLTPATLADKAEVRIGTIAPDLFQNQLLIIDYPRKRLCVTNTLPAEYARASLSALQAERWANQDSATHQRRAGRPVVRYGL